MAKGVSLRAFARIMGVAVSTVQRARDSKRISLNRDGTVDPVKGRREWRDNTLHTRRHAGSPKFEPRVEAGDEGANGNGDGSTSGYQRAREVHETLKARMLELDLLRKQEKLLDAADVHREQFAIARRIRDLLQAMPGRLGPELSGLPPLEASKLLQGEVDRICDELAGGEPSEDGES